MCGRFALRAQRQALNETFGLERVPRAPGRHNIAPGQLVEAVAAEASGRRHMRLFRWGLVP
ncbi:MAG TPA: SOS response-associated peptidase, partial [Desulfovibrio sp.]|nr:SOS response-associated peptidase [Desulfovibrio sp.]